jgi:hypothetical protein
MNPTRHAYEFQILVTPTQPLSHGQGTEGNVQVLRRTQRNVCIGGEWMSLEVPAISGSAFKAVLREAAVDYYLTALGVPEGSLSRDGLRLLLKGGKVGPAGQSTPHEETRRLRRLFPPLAVFGFMDGAITSPGLLQSCELVPYTVELVEAGFFRSFTRLELPPIPDALTSAEVTYYRHDQSTSLLSRYLPGETRAAIEDARSAQSGKIARKEDRRSANESMPHSFEVIPAGTPLLGTLRLSAANDVELACLTLAIASWRTRGAHLGGGRGKGHGICDVQMVRAVRLGVGVGPVPVGLDATLPVETCEVDPGQQVVAEYAAHLASVSEEAIQVLTT